MSNTMKFNKPFLFSLLISLLALGSCSDNSTDPDPEPPQETESKFVIGGAAATAEQDKTYLFVSDDLEEGEITVQGNGYETRGSTMYALNNKVFTFEYNRGDPGFAQVFQLNEGNDLEEVSSFSVKSLNVFMPYNNEQYLLAYNIGRSLDTPGSAYWINTATNLVEKDASIDQKIIYVDGEHIENYYAFVFAFFEFGDNIYAVYQPSYGGEGEQALNDYTDHAFVSVFDKDLNFIKTISDPRMPYIGKYYNTTGLGLGSDGDIYAYSTGDTDTENNHSAFLRITDDEFDQDYYWDVEAEAGKRIFNGRNIGNGNFVLAMIDRDEATAESEGVQLAIADPVAKSFNWVTDIDGKIPPPTYGMPLFSHDDKAYLALSGEGDQASVSYLYTIDPESHTAQRGLKLTGIKDISGLGVLTQPEE